LVDGDILQEKAAEGRAVGSCAVVSLLVVMKRGVSDYYYYYYYYYYYVHRHIS